MMLVLVFAEIIHFCTVKRAFLKVFQRKVNNICNAKTGFYGQTC